VLATDGDGTNDAGEGNVIAGYLFAGVEIAGAGTDGNIVAGNFIGTDVSGTVALGGDFGVFVRNGARFNRIGTNADGTSDLEERNLISGNTQVGVELSDPGTSQNVVAGNFIGSEVTGTQPLGNGIDGVGVGLTNASANRIGGTAAAARNVLSGNAS